MEDFVATEKPYTVYFVQAEVPDHYIKIGRSFGNSESRVRDLQTSCPVDLILVATIDGVKASLEGFLHDLFRDYRVRGEWFFPCDELLDFMSKYGQSPGQTLEDKAIQYAFSNTRTGPNKRWGDVASEMGIPHRDLPLFRRLVRAEMDRWRGGD